METVSIVTGNALFRNSLPSLSVQYLTNLPLPALSDRVDNAYAAPAGHAGRDHVDYGAYTGGYGAFGWYTDHPVLLNGH